MRWSIIRLIWARELRDQLRDRRTLFMIAILPLVLYPVGGLGLMYLALGFLGQSSKVQIVGHQYLPAASPLPAATWAGLTPPAPGCPLAGVERVAGTFALSEARNAFEFPPLLDLVDDEPHFHRDYFEDAAERKSVQVKLSNQSASTPDEVIPTELTTREVDLILFIPPQFAEQIVEGKPEVYLLTRKGDDRSRLVSVRVDGILKKWKRSLKETRLFRRNLPPDYDEPFKVHDPDDGKSTQSKASDEVSKILAQIFPFVLVMWSLAGALYPAVDVCAGEKERGTMETLLISPASREEIVWGKFLTIWVFSAATALLNLLSMGFTTWAYTSRLGNLVTFQFSFLIWGSILLVPLSAFFSALCLAVGVYARSSKEGQYYLMPLFLVTMPLVFLTLAPGVELNHFYSMVPVTGVALFLQSLMKTGPEGKHLFYLVPVLVPTMLYSWLALRWAIEQFQREEVLFREAERLDIGLWLKRLFREKDEVPSTGQAVLCFLLVAGLHWLTLSVIVGRVGQLPTILATAGALAIGYLTILSVPVFMALLLTSKPTRALRLGKPSAWSWVVAPLLAGLMVVFGAVVTFAILQHPVIRESLQASQPGFREGEVTPGEPRAAPLDYFLGVLMLALAQALCEELVFRGFILTGLRRRFRPWPAILISSFLFAVFQLNVFQCVPHFALGVVMGFLVWRSGSLWPAILFHFVYNALLYLLLLSYRESPASLSWLVDEHRNLAPLAMPLAGVAAVVAVAVLAGIALRTRPPDGSAPDLTV